MQRIVRVPTGADVLVHIVPVKVFQLLRGEVHTAHLVRVVLRCMEAIPIVDVDRWIGMATKGSEMNVKMNSNSSPSSLPTLHTVAGSV